MIRLSRTQLRNVIPTSRTFARRIAKLLQSEVHYVGGERVKNNIRARHQSAREVARRQRRQQSE